MLDYSRLSTVAELIRDHISLDGIEQYCAKTNVCKEDYVVIEHCDFSGKIFAVDGSNVAICDWSVANLNLIRAGYVVYRGRDWQRTVVTYDDIFLADPKICAEEFNPYLDQIFGLKGIDLEDSDLDRLSTYFRELQEYIALNEAILEACPDDIILYDGSFDVFMPLREVLSTIFARAKRKGVALLAISKSSSLLWGDEISLPFVQHTNYAGSMFFPGFPWYICLKDKNVDHGQGRWNGETYIVRFSGRSERAFRVDAPAFLTNDIGPIFSKLAAYSCSAECLGYPHALFRAHRDIRITSEEGVALRQKLMAQLYEMGMSQMDVRMLMQDYHDVLEMNTGV
jgi:hypothetical protein